MAPISYAGAPLPPKSRPKQEEHGGSLNADTIQFGRLWLEVVRLGTSVCAVLKSFLHNWQLPKSNNLFLAGVRCLNRACYQSTKPKSPLSSAAPIMFVHMIIVQLYFAFAFGYLPEAGLSFHSPTSLIFHAVIGMVIASNLQAIWTDPGGVPHTSYWMTQGTPPREAHQRKRKDNGCRWCKNESLYKPDRAHYCKMQQRNVLRMDHHCPWLGNTVGFANYKFFFLFILYTNIACFMMQFGFVSLLLQKSLHVLPTILLLGSEFLTLLLNSILCPFCMFHAYLVRWNLTTIEFCETRSSATDPEIEVPKLTYDRGIYNNICSVLGSNPLTWFIPTGHPPGDGLSFLTHEDLESERLEALHLETSAEDRSALSELVDDFKVGCEDLMNCVISFCRPAPQAKVQLQPTRPRCISLQQHCVSIGHGGDNSSLGGSTRQRYSNSSSGSEFLFREN